MQKNSQQGRIYRIKTDQELLKEHFELILSEIKVR